MVANFLVTQGARESTDICGADILRGKNKENKNYQRKYSWLFLKPTSMFLKAEPSSPISCMCACTHIHMHTRTHSHAHLPMLHFIDIFFNWVLNWEFILYQCYIWFLLSQFAMWCWHLRSVWMTVCIKTYCWTDPTHWAGKTFHTLTMTYLLYPPYPKDRGMLWFYVEAARNGVNAITQKPRDGLFSNLVYTLVVIVSWPD